MSDVWPGVPYPLGATFDGRGVNFAVFSKHATKIEVCLYDSADPQREVRRVELVDCTNEVFHGYVPGLTPGALYGLRAHGPWNPSAGLRFNPNKLLVDPYARAISGKPNWKAPLAGHVHRDGVESLDAQDSAWGVPRCVVIADDYDWSGDKRPEVLWRKAIIYELHVKGFTARHPDIPPHQRGTYAGLAHPAAIAHLTKLGVTSVQLLPVHEAVSEGFLVEKGLTNYWGYNTLGFFAPDQRFSSSGNAGQQVREFKDMVKALHAAGIEVLLDVVYNHTCEGNHLGPTLSLRGLDNPTYYWREPNDPSRYRDFTGCGNSLDVSHPRVLKLVMDSLRTWVNEFHVDGFRFDLATTLARAPHSGFDGRSLFFAALHQDPVLSRVKLIAEPWDVGEGGYRLGQFPPEFSEWNDRYRQTVRRFWRSDEGQLADLGYRLSGSSDLFRTSGRRPSASLNFVTCHDGFTLRDLVSYASKHNEANGEDNRDGSSDNDAWNWGAEGETSEVRVNTLRARMQRNYLATLFFSLGTPMLLAGDEMGRTQRGNNNAYCQDNELSWVDWQLDDERKALLEFTRRCIALRQTQPVLQRRNFFLGETLDASRFRDLVWFHPNGHEMTGADWNDAKLKAVGLFFGGDAIATRGPSGQKVVGDTLLAYFNASAEVLEAKVPGKDWGSAWQLVLETARGMPRELVMDAGQTLLVPPHAVIIFRQRAV